MINHILKISGWVVICIACAACAARAPHTEVQAKIPTPVSSYTAVQKRIERTRTVVPIDTTEYVRKVDNFLIIFDPSASMSEPYGEMPKFELAMDTAIHLNRAIPDLELTGGLRTFGNPVYTSLVYGFESYSKNSFENALHTIENTDGVSPLDFALDQTAKDIIPLRGPMGIIIISDGKDMDISPVLSARKLKKKYGENVCIHTILVGDNPDGAKILVDIANETACGIVANADDLASARGMADFVTKVFLTRPLPQEIASAADSDADGITDDRDDCPNSPAGADVDEQGCWEMVDVLFDFDKYDIKPVYYKSLDTIARVLMENPGIKIRIDGHTDIIGLEKYNGKLSINRAKSGKAYLNGKGISEERIAIKGYGYSMPRDTNESAEGRHRNRRIEFQRIP